MIIVYVAYEIEIKTSFRLGSILLFNNHKMGLNTRFTASGNNLTNTQT